MQQVIVYLHPPRDWQVFQNLIVDLAKLKYDEISVQEFGRQGQRQNGVDVYAVDASENSIGMQCKETKSNELKEQDIIDECVKAEKFTPPLKHFIICTTLRIDAKAQQIVNQINADKKYKFKVQIWFWENINTDINKSSKLLFSLYDDYAQKFEQTDIARHLEAICLAFNRPAFCDDFLNERNYNDFEDALSSTKQLLRTGILIDRMTKEIINQVIPTDKIGCSEYKKFVYRIEAKLEQIYQKYIRNKREISSSYQQAVNFAGVFNIERKKLIEIVNKQLTINGLQPIQVQY